MNTFSRTLILFLLLGAPLLHAQRPETVVIPYDPSLPVEEQHPSSVYLPYDRFLSLWSAAKVNRIPSEKAPAPLSWTISSARYDGVLGERNAAFTAKLDLLTANEEWVRVPLPFGQSIKSLLLDGAPADLREGCLIVEHPGRHHLEIAFEVPVTSSHFAFQVPRSATAEVALTLNDTQSRIMISPADGTVEQVVDGKRLISAMVGSTGEIDITISSASADTRFAEPASAEVQITTLIDGGYERVTSTVTYAFTGARQDHFTMLLDKGLKLAKLDAIGIKHWRLFPEKEMQALEIVLSEPASDSFQVTVEAGRPLAAFPLSGTAAQVSAKAGRVEVLSVLLAGAGVELTPSPAEGLRQIGWTEKSRDGGRLIAAYAGAGALGWQATQIKAGRQAREMCVYQVDRRKVELIASMTLTAETGGIFDLSVNIPAEFEVQAVHSARLQDWWRDGQKLYVRFSGPGEKETAVELYLVRQYAAAPEELDIVPLKLDGFESIHGEAVIAAYKGVDAVLTFKTAATEIAPDLAAPEFLILSPLERKRGFRFANADYSGKVKLTTLPAKWSAEWVMQAEAHESWISASTHARVSLKQGSLDTLVFALPEGCPVARVTGEGVRETRSRKEGGLQVYDVQLQSAVYDSAEVTIDFDLPNTGAVVLPSITWPGAQATSGHVLVENASEYEMHLDSSGVESSPVAEIPFLPVLSRKASLFRVHAGWSVAVHLDRLEKAESRAAFASYAELVTALRENGEEWHRATYHLQNRSLQYLPVRLPVGSELMSVRVAGESVRAESGEVGGKPVILAPLIKTKPGDLSFDVEIVYRRTGKTLGAWSTSELADPELPGITVERTLWDVWLPEGRRLWSASGNMEPVLAEVKQAEKAESTLAELKSLVSVVSASKSSAAVRRRALGNISSLQKQLQAESYSSRTVDSFAVGKDAALDKKQAAQQRGDLSRRRQMLGNEVAIANQKLADAENVNQQDAGRQEDDLQDGDGSQSASTTKGEEMQSQPLLRSGESRVKWKENETAKGVSPPVIAANTSKQDIYFNDHVAWSQASPSKDGKEASDSRSEENAKQKLLVSKMDGESSSEADLAVSNSAAEGGKKSASEKQEGGESQKSQVFLNTARANADANAVPPEENKPTVSDVEKHRFAFKVGNDNGNGAFDKVDSLRLDTKGGTRTGAVFMDASTFTPTDAAAGKDLDAPSPRQSLAPQGRVSLVIDFPTEGKVYHFQKLKAHAELSMTSTRPAFFDRFRWLGVLLLCASALFLLDRFSKRIWHALVRRRPWKAAA